MESNSPEFLYKYRSVANSDNPANEYSLINLFNNEATFSSRTNFNDLFDSKVNLIKPTTREIKELAQQVDKPSRRRLLSLIDRGNFSPDGLRYLENVATIFDQLIDKYSFISFSSRADSNLMWSHYANSHYGFCIEFKGSKIQSSKVNYQPEIPSLRIIDFLKVDTAIDKGVFLGEKVLLALCTKLSEWQYESEYRHISNDKILTLGAGIPYRNVAYELDWVESIIFGYRMKPHVRQLIIDGLPSGVNFKEAVPDMNAMKIRPYNKKSS